LCAWGFGFFVTQDNVARGFARRRLSLRVERCKKRYQGRGLRWAQIFPVRRHIAATLDYLADQLVLRQSHRDTIERRPSLAAEFTKRMAISALLGLKYERALPLKRGGAM
jgi:hypothetical protein